MELRPLGRTGFEIAPLVLGGNVFGWTADAATSFALLDAFVDAGLNAIDTADVYSRLGARPPGRRIRDDHRRLARAPTRASATGRADHQGRLGDGPGPAGPVPALDHRGRRGLAAAAAGRGDRPLPLPLARPRAPRTPRRSAPTPALIDAGKVRAIGASNLDAAQLAEALDVADATGLPRYEVLQPGYNLHDRERARRPAARPLPREGLGVITYFSLAKGFLSGKYRSDGRPRQEPARRRRRRLPDRARLRDPRRARRRRRPPRRHARRGGARLGHGASRASPRRSPARPARPAREPRPRHHA